MSFFIFIMLNFSTKKIRLHPQIHSTPVRNCPVAIWLICVLVSLCLLQDFGILQNFSAEPALHCSPLPTTRECRLADSDHNRRTAVRAPVLLYLRLANTVAAVVKTSPLLYLYLTDAPLRVRTQVPSTFDSRPHLSPK